MKLLAGSFALVAGLAVNSAQAMSSWSFVDGDFNSWSLLTYIVDDQAVPGPPPGLSSSATSIQSSGGNPGAFRQTTHQVVSGDRIVTIGIDLSFTYDVSLHGAIDSISVGVDLLHPSAGSTGWRLVIEQDDTLYYATSFGIFGQNSAWTKYSGLSVGETAFDAALGGPPSGATPDFSIAGSPMQFGVVFTNSFANGTGTSTNTFGLDNFSISVTSVPEPSTTVALGVGLLLLSFALRPKYAALG